MRGIKGLRFAGVLLLVVLGVLVAVWYVAVTGESERYLTSRNFRLLSTIATQLDSSISGQQRTLATLLKAKTKPGADWFTEAKAFVPSLQALDEERIPKPLSPLPRGTASKDERKGRAILDDRGAWLEVTITRFEGSRQSVSTTRTAWLNLDGLLAPIFTPKLREGAFDALVLASTEGRVLHAEGRLGSALTLARLDQLEPARRSFLTLGNAPQPSRAPGFPSVARTSGVVDVRISGTTYKLFTQPCCLATPTPASDGSQTTTGLVIVGLVDAAAFHSKARQISPTVVMAWIALILLTFASWPFLKVRLIGERQRIRRLDVVQVIASGLFGIALLTVVFVDFYAQRQLRQTRDDHLQTLATKISVNVRAELNDAFDQLETVTKAILPCGPTRAGTIETRGGKTETGIFAGATLRQCDGAPITQWYPHFKTMALIDNAGMQHVKWTSRKWQPAPISVASRVYFTEAMARRYWRLPLPDGEPTDRRYLLESIWSWTTTEPEAVLSLPTGHKALPVATVTIPMMSLVDPVIAAGFEFAVIRDDGDVMFHSDPQRNTYENLFEETDQDRRLRAAVAAHIHEHLDLRYAGRSYRAYVMRLGAGTPWSVVTLTSNDTFWALHTEWLVLALAALGVHMLVMAAMFALCFFTGRADWLWADPDQHNRYVVLFCLVVVSPVVAARVMYVGSNTEVLTASCLLPIAVWAAAYALLRLPHFGVPPLKFPVPYTLLTGLMFLLTAVIPAIGYFSVAYRMQVRTDVKYTQLQLARDIPRRADRLTRVYEERLGVVPRTTSPVADLNDLYYAFPYTTSLSLATPEESQKPRDSSEDAGGILQKVLEEYLPYYSERSVQMRELLLHEGATDHAWWWLNDDRPALILKGDGGEPSVKVSSEVPPLLPGIWMASEAEFLVWIVLPVLALVALTWSVVHFIETYVCLRGVEQPLWSRLWRAGNSGDNLLVVCDPSERKVLSEGTFELRFETPSGTPIPDHELTRQLLARDRTDLGMPVLLADFNDHLDNPKLTRRKLDWIERLAADQSRPLIVLSDSPSLLAFPSKSQAGPASGQLLQRWLAVRMSFAVINRRVDQGAQDQAATSWWREALKALRAGRVRDLLTLQRDRTCEALDREGQSDAFVQAVCESIKERLRPSVTGAGVATPTMRLSPDQALDEVAERTDAWYRRIWRTCSPDEQLVLAEIASEGFVNYKSRRTVRRLLGRRLIAKDPSFRLMNATFRRFVLSATCQHDIHAIEGASDPSSWDQFRAPFYLVLMAALTFFLLTQQEMFNATIATLSTVTAALPMLVRVVALVAGKRAELEIPKV